MKLILINPNLDDGRGCLTYLDGKFKRLFIIPSMTMPYIAALTSPDIEVEIWDETLGDEINYDVEADIVGITCVTQLAAKAYRIADSFRSRGIRVVLGGCHPTIMPNEAKNHADAVVIGDADQVWGELIRDFKQGKLRPFYQGDPDFPLNSLPSPRMDLLQRKKYYLCFKTSVKQIKLSRGCPNYCSTCCIPLLYEHRYRYRQVRDVVREVEESPEKYIYFCEDNILGDAEYARKLFRELIPLKKKWVSVSSIRFAEGDLPELARKSGCVSIFLGLESPSRNSLVDMRKSDNIDKDLRSVVNKVHDAGIMVTGGFLVGFDHDNKDVFKRIVDFVFETALELVQYYLIVPIPRTALYKKLKLEERLIREKWWMNDYYSQEVLFEPKQMTREELAEGFMYMTTETYRIISIVNRLFRRGILEAPNIPFINRIGAFGFNLAFKEMYEQQKNLFKAKLSMEQEAYNHTSLGRSKAELQ